MSTLIRSFQVFFMGLLLLAFSAMARETSNSPAGGEFLYTVSNSQSGNSVIGYSVGAGGRLTQLPGSPFSTRGFGQGEFVLGNSDNGLVISTDRRFLFAPNRGSNTIAVFAMQRNGELRHVPGSPFPTGGVTPVSLALHGDLLYVAHLGSGLPFNCFSCAYRGFRVHRTGRLTPLEGSIIELSQSPPAIPFALRFSPDGRFLIGTELGTSRINVFRVRRDRRGRLSTPVLAAVPGSPFASIGKQPFGFRFHPVNPTQLFISNVETLAVPQDVPGSVSSYLVASSGQIAPITTELPSNGGQLAPCWVSLTDDGQILFVTNTDSDSVSTYRVAEDGRLTLLQVTDIPRGGIDENLIIGPVDMAVSINNKYLYMPTRDVPTVVGFEIHADGNLTPIPGVDPLPISVPDAVPFGMAFVDFNQPDQVRDSSE